jgi:hypothetical protein
LVTQPGRTKKSAPKVIPVTSAVPSADRTSITLTLGKYAAKPLTLQGSRLVDAVG